MITRTVCWISSWPPRGEAPPAQEAEAAGGAMPHVMGYLGREGLMERGEAGAPEPPDMTRAPMEVPACLALRLQALARGDEGVLLGFAYSTQRGYARNHAFVGNLRIGAVAVEMDIPELGFAIELGDVMLTECETVNQFTGSKTAPS